MRGPGHPAVARRCRPLALPDQRRTRGMGPRRLYQGAREGLGARRRRVEGLEPTILSFGPWKLNATVVERLVQGRVMMCGDAAHQFPPTGGLGVNTGLQALATRWKLALCVQGKPGWPVLSTYHIEHRGVSPQITMQSLQNSMNLVCTNAAAVAGAASGLSTEEGVATVRWYGNHLGVEFGAVYDCPPSSTTGPARPSSTTATPNYVQSATPGCPAPHVWLGGPRRSCRRWICSAPRSRCSPAPTALPVDHRSGGHARARHPNRCLHGRERRLARSRRPRGGVRARRRRCRARASGRLRRPGQSFQSGRGRRAGRGAAPGLAP